MGFARKFGKCILVTFNIFFMLLGIALLAVGAIFKFVPGKIFSSIDDVTSNLPFQTPQTLDFLPLFDTVGVVLLVFGALLLVLALTGFCWLCFDATCFLVLFAVLLSALVLAQAVLGGMILAPDSVLHSKLRGSLTEKLESEYQQQASPNGAYTLLANLLASQLQCCGYGGVGDFDFLRRADEATWETYMVPCCHSDVWMTSNATFCVSNMANNIYQTGCYETLLGYIEQRRPIVIAVFVIVLLAQIVAVVVAAVLARKSAKEKVGLV